MAERARRIRARPAGGTIKCPLCLARLDEEESASLACPGCKVQVHVECARELGGCSTAGCARRGAAPTEAASKERDRRRAEIFARHEARVARRLAEREAAEDRRERLGTLLQHVGLGGVVLALALASLGVVPRNGWLLGLFLMSAVASGIGQAFRREEDGQSW